MRRAMQIFAYVCLLLGMIILTYPYVQQWLYMCNANSLIEEFNQKTKKLQEQAPQTNKKNSTVSYLADLYAAMQAYNENLYKNGQCGFKDAWSYQPSSFDLSAWGFDENIVGYLDIPKMSVKLPIYLGATVENMKKGAVHLTETSLPIGGENVNCVIAAHRGYFGTPMLRDIEILQIGDKIMVTNLWETLVYQVTDIKIILPNETDKLLIRPKQDLVTLITCHPYRYNYQRYVVYCKRVLK